MTQDEKWMLKYNEVVVFIETNHRNPSRHRLEEHDMLNWVKQQRKMKNKGELKAERAEMLERLLSLCEEYKRVNQWG
ncbi:helicase associated domain-containing protein [Prevotella communis]|jgi:hypothetical protein